MAETRTAVICVRDWDRAHRVWHDKAATLAKHGIPPDRAYLCEDDDLIPVCLGGGSVATEPLAAIQQRQAGRCG